MLLQRLNVMVEIRKRKCKRKRERVKLSFVLQYTFIKPFKKKRIGLEM